MWELSPKASGTGHGLPFQDSWGAYSPWQPHGDYSVPPGCQVKMANVIQRHGARYPTEDFAEHLQEAVKSMQAVPEWKDQLFKFIPSYRYLLGENDLVPFGAKQSFDAGVVAALRYQTLGLPYVRASDSPRVVYSAKNWTAGYTDVTGHTLPAMLVIDETGPLTNTTLNNNMCPPAFNHHTNDERDAWADKAAPKIIKRLRRAAVPPSSLKMQHEELFSLMALCSFDTLSSAKFDTPPGQEPTSPWCGLWTEKDIQKFEYWMDIDKYYDTGYGNKLGPVQGIGYVDEILARLTRTPVAKWDAHKRTSVNHTLDDNHETFPLDRNFYVDFSHDDQQIVAIVSALQLQKPKRPLSPSKWKPSQEWVASAIVPYSARLVFEVLECGAEQPQQVRALLNDAVVQLPTPCPADAEHKLCQLDTFVESQKWAESGAQKQWNKCRKGLHESSLDMA
ncbi:phytase [Auriculariales sp. MPI-PUGE-AT-0066]|nr:phytase [Auriculariales sp. MPI-PUGE-AT-0066]